MMLLLSHMAVPRCLYHCELWLGRNVVRAQGKADGIIMARDKALHSLDLSFSLKSTWFLLLFSWLSLISID